MDDPAVITTDSAPRAIGPYSQAIRSDGWLYTSGQIALDPSTGELIKGSIEEEAGRVLDNLSAILEAGQSSLLRVVKTTVFLTDLAHFAAVNEVYGRRFGSNRPARSTVQVAALPRGARIEIEAVARVG